MQHHDKSHGDKRNIENGPPFSATDMILFQHLSNKEKIKTPDDMGSFLQLHPSDEQASSQSSRQKSDYGFFGNVHEEEKEKKSNLFNSYLQNEFDRFSSAESYSPKSRDYDRYRTHDRDRPHYRDRAHDRDRSYDHREREHDRESHDYRERERHHPDTPPSSSGSVESVYFHHDREKKVERQKEVSSFIPLQPRNSTRPDYFDENMNRTSTLIQKQHVFGKLQMYEANGYKLSVKLSPDTPLSELQMELDFIEETENSMTTVNNMRIGLSMFMGSVETVNGYFLGDVIPLSNWSEDTFKENPYAFDPSLRRIYNMYWRNSYQHPLLELGTALAMSAGSHMVNQCKKDPSKLLKIGQYATNNRMVKGAMNMMGIVRPSMLDPFAPQASVPHPQASVPHPQASVPHPQASVPRPQASVPRPHATMSNPPTMMSGMTNDVPDPMLAPPVNKIGPPPMASSSQQTLRPGFRPPFSSNVRGEPVSALPIS